MATLHPYTAYLSYLKHSVSKHGVHSPFVFDLVTKVFPSRKQEDFSEHIAEDWRTECFLNNTIINVTDLGTGISGPRKVSDIAKHAAKKIKQGELLHRIVQHFQPKKIVELGTSLGITTSYEALASEFEKFISLEGCPETAAIAKVFFEKNNLHVEVRVGDFSDTLPKALNNLEQVDYVYFDGNHKEIPTLNYFETCLPFAHKDSIFIFDDIHWSEEMESAWEKIKSHPKVKLSIDLFHFGIVFFREEQLEKEHFVLRY